MQKIIEDGSFFFRDAFTANPQSWSDDKHMHDRYELYYIIQGDADYVINDRIIHLQENSLLFIRPSVFHYLKLLSNVSYHRVTIHFADKDIDSTFISGLDQIQIYYSFHAESLITRYYDHCIQIAETYKEADAIPCLRKFLNLIIKELQYCQEYTTKGAEKLLHPLFSEIINYINTHIEQPLSAPILAKEFSVSPSWIMQSFRKFLNISTMNYITHKKILHAKQLIENGTPPMVVSKQCGFENYSTFYMQYKKILGINPAKTK